MPQLFIHVIESPSSQDLLDGRTEGRVLIEALKLSQIPATYNLVTDLSTLNVAMEERLVSAATEHDALPIIHLSLHGCNEGVALTNEEFLTWQQLREILLPINQDLEGRLLVCLSSCYGAFGRRMAMREREPLPFFALVGHPESATWDDSAIAFVVFYHQLFKGASLDNAVEAMKVASGDDRFFLTIGEDIQQEFSEYFRQKRAEDIRERLQRLRERRR